MFSQPTNTKRQKLPQGEIKKPVQETETKKVEKTMAIKHFEEEKKGAEFVKPKAIAKDAFIQKQDKDDTGFFRDRQKLVDRETREQWEEEQRRLKVQLVLED